MLLPELSNYIGVGRENKVFKKRIRRTKSCMIHLKQNLVEIFEIS